jgi:hypothetical protein
VLDCTPKLPWQERFDEWERWTAAIPQWSDRKARQTLIPADMLPFDISANEVAEESELSMDSSKDWSSELHTETRAVFGHAVFARPDLPPSVVPPSESHTSPSPSQLDASLPRTFVPALPALGNLNLPSNLLEKGLWHMTLVLRFTPSPGTTISAPDLELRMDADHKEIKALSSLRAISDTFTGDVLFPAATVDTRVVQQRYFDLPVTSIEERIPAVLAFLAKSDLRPWVGKLSTPHTLPDVLLPRRIVFPQTESDNNTNTTTTNNDPIPINYTLAHHQIERTVTGEYESLKLRYTSIQAGQSGGARAELSLDAVRVEPQLPDPTPSTTDTTTPSSSSSSSSTQPWETDSAYEIIDEADLRAQLGGGTDTSTTTTSGSFVSHSLNNPDNKPAPTSAAGLLPAKPVTRDEFVQVASGIVHERGRLKWHAKRS